MINAISFKNQRKQLAGHRRMTIVSKERIKREYEAIRPHESVKDAIQWTAHKLNVSEQDVAEVVYEIEEVEA